MPDDTTERELVNMGAAGLSFFLNDRFSPILHQIESVDSLTITQTNFIHAELLESFIWLHHGAEINYFPINLSRRLTYEYFPLFLKAYESASKTAHFNTWFTPPIQAIWKSEFSGEQALFSSRRAGQGSKHRLESHSLFQPFFVLANGFVQNQNARPFVQALVGSGLTAPNESPVTIDGTLEGDDRPDAASSNFNRSGLFQTIEYMQAFRRMNYDLLNAFPNMDKDMQDYVRLLKETQQWRMNFGYLPYRERFVQLARVAAKTYVRHFPSEEMPAPEASVEEFIKNVIDLMTDWGAPIVKAAGA